MRRFLIAAGAAGVLGAVIPVAHADGPASPSPDITGPMCQWASTSGSVGSHSVGPVCTPDPLAWQLCFPAGAQAFGATVSGQACVPFPIALGTAGRAV
jgi:hypothetical protein